MGERDMNNLMKIGHPGEEHHLSFKEGSLPFSQTCHKCKQQVSRDYYECRKYGCDEYYLHKECVELKDLLQVDHPLHPQHPLVFHFHFPCDKSFICSFCGETKESRSFYQCSDDQCEFYLDNTCESDFMKRPELLEKYEIQHVFHENDRLSPCSQIKHYELEYFPQFKFMDNCAGCRESFEPIQRFYKCTGCDFYLHTKCSQVPKEVQQHYSHPQHPLFLLQNPRAASKQLRCIACLKHIHYEFYLHCIHCPTFNLDLQCYFQKPNVKHGAHQHPLAYIGQIYDDDDVLCYACNSPCKSDLFRCFTCSFYIHSDCVALPFIVNYDDHVHPLTLTTSFKEDDHPTAYYCDICERKRDPDHGLYLCRECPFMAHFECALSLSTTQKDQYKQAHWRQMIQDHNNHALDDKKDMALITDEIFDQLNDEIEELRLVTGKLIIEKREGEQLTEMLQEFEEGQANIEDLLRRLKQSVIVTKSN